MITSSEVRSSVELNPAKDEVVTDLRLAVIALWERLTCLLWDARTDYVEIVTPNGTEDTMIWLQLQNPSIPTLIEELIDGTWTTVASTDYYLIRTRLTRKTGFWASHVRVTYSGGYSATTCPADIKRALIVQAGFMYQRLADDKLIIKAVSLNNKTGLYEDADYHPYFRQTVAKYMRKF